MESDFDRIIDRRHTDSIKWRHYGDDVLPLWVADMDFASPEPVIRALRERVEHGIFGYGTEPEELREVIVSRLGQLYGWQVSPESLVFLPGVVTGLYMTCYSLAGPGDGVLVQPPVYPPIYNIPKDIGLLRQENVLVQQPDGRYGIDFEAFEEAITEQTRLFILCNPHNPVGRVFTRAELERMAEICLRHRLVICSDEIHCDLIFRGSRHVPLASLAPEVAAQTITFMAPSKTYNIAGLQCAVAIIPNPELRKTFIRARRGLVPEVNLMGFVAALAAYRDGQPWLEALLEYLEANRDYLATYVEAHLPGIAMTKMEGTYLAWLDCRRAGIPDNPHRFFLKRARVALNDGVTFGSGGEGFVRLNFGCPRATLTEALNRMREALATLH